MVKIVVPGSNEKEKAIFKKLNINLKESISEKEFEHEVIAYLNQHNVLHLATSKNDIPRSTPLEYFNNGLIVYVLSMGGDKFANLMANPKVCFSISDPYEPAEDFFGAVGVQVWGNALIFKKNDDKDRFEQINKYSRNVEVLKKHGLDQMATQFNFNVIAIEPLRIRYLNMRKGFRNVSWEKDA